MAEVILLALGHPDCSDDGFGECLLRRFEADYRLPPSLLCLYGGNRPMAHYDRIAGCRWLVLLDAVRNDSPGLLIVDPLPPQDPPPAMAVHQLGASELLQLMTVLGDAPERVSLVGAPFECLDWGRALSPALEQCLPQACESLAALLGRGGIDLERKTACTN